MLYTEYLDCAKKHWTACNLAVNSLLGSSQGENASSGDFELLLDIYYLSGYIVEGCTVYSAYHLGDFPSFLNVKEYNHKFTSTTKIDFFQKRLFNPKHPEWISQEDFDKRCKLVGLLFIHGHNFQEIIRCYLEKELQDREYKIPYLESTTPIDPNVKTLLDQWKPEIRYKTAKTKNFFQQKKLINLNTIQELINLNTIQELIKICGNIISSVDQYLPI